MTQPPPPYRQPAPPQQYPPHWPQQQYPLPHQQANHPPHQWPAQHLPGASIGTHLKRAIDWNVATIAVAPKERLVLEAAGVHGRLQAMFVWRRSSLMVATPFLLLGVILSFTEVIKAHLNGDLDGLSGLGVAVRYTPSVALLIMPLACVVAIAKWTQLRSASRLLVSCWLFSVALPLIAALIPLDLLVDGDLSTVDDSTQIGLRVLLAVQYALQLLPIVLSVPGGVLKGAARVKSLYPASVLPGWFLVSVAPFYSLFTIVTFVLIDQIVGNLLLMLGVALLAFGPWLFVVYRKVYARPLSIAESQQELGRASRLGGIFLWGGIACIVVFALTGKVTKTRHVLGPSSSDGTAFFSYLDVSNTVVQLLARGIVTAVVFSIFFLHMIHTQWRNMQTMRPDIKREHDDEMRSLERWVTRMDTAETAQTTVNPVYRP